MTNTKTFTTAEVAALIGVTVSAIHQYTKRYNMKPKHTGKGKASSMWTTEEVRRLAEARGIELGTEFSENENLKPDAPAPETAMTIPAPKNPIDILIEMADHVEQDENVSAFMHLKQLYDTYNERDLSVMFGEVLRRFKFSYITECVPSVQSQTLTAIRKGSLRGIDSFQFSFKSFLELMKFAGEHNTPVTEVSKQ